jgi:hypothetical protein
MPSMVRVREFEREWAELHASCTLRLEYAGSVNGWVGGLVSLVHVRLPWIPNTAVRNHILTIKIFFIHVLSDCLRVPVLWILTRHTSHAALNIINHTS